MKYVHIMVLGMVSYIFFSCGSGGEDEGTSGAGSQAISADTAQLENQIVSGINTARAGQGLTILPLNSLARNNARLAARANLDAYLSGNSGDQSIGFVALVHYLNQDENGQRLTEDQIIEGKKIKENLFATTQTLPSDTVGQARTIVTGWIESNLGHCENTFYSHHEQVGVGVSVGTDNRGRTVVVVSGGFVCDARNCFAEPRPVVCQ